MRRACGHAVTGSSAAAACTTGERGIATAVSDFDGLNDVVFAHRGVALRLPSSAAVAVTAPAVIAIQRSLQLFFVWRK